MSVSIVVPFRSDGAERDRNWAWLEERLRTLYPDWELVVGTDDSDGPWCKGAVLNAAVRRCSGDLLVVSDADMYLVDEVMQEAVRRLEDSVWVVPHRLSYRLTDEATKRLMAGRLDPDELTHDDFQLPARRMFPCGGVFFVHKVAYLEAGGIDERFTGWGGEDESFGMVLQTLYGDPVFLGSVLLHLWHQPQPEMPPDRLRPPHADALVKRYEAAKGDREAMLSLIA